jgi:hypothetical protein
LWTGLRGANQRLGKIFLWSLFAATVSLIIQGIESALRRQNNLMGSIVGSILGTAWTLATYFVIPVILFEDLGIFRSLKRSGQLFKNRWGASLVGQYGIGFVFSIITFAIGFVTFMAFRSVGLNAAGVTIIAVGVMAILLTVVVGSALGVVYKAALYRFAKQAEVPAGFPPQLLENAYRPTGN